MSKLSKIKNRLVLPVIGFILACFMTIAPISATPVYADPTIPAESTPATTESSTESSTDTSTSESEDSSDNSTDLDSSQKTTCSSQVGALGWLLCPATGFLSKGIDFLYGLIEKLLVVDPLLSTEGSPIFIVWTYLRNLTNIVFVIFLLIIIYSQITGLGINNYGIKKALPKLIIVALLVNLSYSLCALAIDVSNIIGSSLNNFLASIGEEAIANSGVSISLSINFYDVFAAIAGVGTITALGIAISGGALQLLLAIIPTVIAGIIAVLIGLATISLRQAVVIALAVISPLAFVAFLLPNTEKWYQKWISIFSQMLFFYPMFSLLFGISRLIGWMFIANASQNQDAFGAILGLAIQIFPLFLAIPLMKMSGTVLGSVSNALGKLGDKINGGVRGYIDPFKEAKRAEQIAKASQKAFNPFSGSSWMAHRAKRLYRLNDRTRMANENTQNLNEEQLNALKRGTRIIGYDRKTGEAIYTQRPISIQSGPLKGQVANASIRRALDAEASNRAIKLRLTDSKLRTDNVHNVLNDYLKENGITKGQALEHSSQNGETFFRIDQASREKANQDLADQRFVLGRYAKAMKRDPRSGELINPEEYKKYIQSSLGSDGFQINQQTDEGRRNAFVSEANFIGAVSQTKDAYHAGNIQRAQSYLNSQVTNIVDKYYANSLNNEDTDNIIAATSTLAIRGDYDKIKTGLIKYFNDGKIDLTTDASNRLAFHFLQMKASDPSLARFGKFINMETWAYTSGRRQEQTVTYDQFDTGFIKADNLSAVANNPLYDNEGFLYETKADGSIKYDDNNNPILYRPKVNLASAMEGTSLNGIDRTFFGSLNCELRNITQDKLPSGVSVKQVREEVNRALMPQIISALPTFLSGSEQIRTTVGFLTGMKYNSNTKQWLDDIDNNSDIPDSAKELEREIMKDTYELYLASLTPRNLIDIKTDTWEAINARIKRDARALNKVFTKDTTNPQGQFIAKAGTPVYDASRSDEENDRFATEYAYANLRDLLAQPIEKLASGSLSIENMKIKPRKALGIDELRDQRRKKKKQVLERYDDLGETGPLDDAVETYEDEPVANTQSTRAQSQSQSSGHRKSKRQRSGDQPATHPEPQYTSQPVDQTDSDTAETGGSSFAHNINTGGSGGGNGNNSSSQTNMAILQALNEVVSSNHSFQEQVAEVLNFIKSQNSSDESVGDAKSELERLKEQESDERIIHLLQAIVDVLNRDRHDDPRPGELPGHDFNDPTSS